MYVIDGKTVRWQPAIDVNRIILGGQIVVSGALTPWTRQLERRIMDRDLADLETSRRPGLLDVVDFAVQHTVVRAVCCVRDVPATRLAVRDPRTATELSRQSTVVDTSDTARTPNDGESLTFSSLLALEPHGPDTFVGVSPPYGWGRIYGGQVIAQALYAAAETVPAGRPVHSLHAYFILGGRLDEPVRYEVDRVRNGRSFMTRRVVARQSYGAILTLEASFHIDEPGPNMTTVAAPDAVPAPEELPELGWGWMLQRRQVPGTPGSGRAITWVRVDDTVGDDPVRHAAGLAFASDTGTVSAVRALHPMGDVDEWQADKFMGASLDHAVWFHRPVRSDRWLLIDVQCDSLTGVRGLTIGRIFDDHGHHVATVTQEALVRERHTPRSDGPADLSGT